VRSQDSNVARMRWFVEQVQEKGRVELIDGLVRPDFRNHTVEPGQRDDRAGIAETTAAMHEAFSDDAVSLLRQTGALG
jgi:hypothetical protein